MKLSFSPSTPMSNGKRVGNAIAFAFVASLVAMTIVGIVGSSNIVWGEGNQYGRIDIPGEKDVTLPAGDVLANIAIALPGRGNETPTMRLPQDIALTVTAPGGQNVTVTEDIQTTENAMDDLDDTQRQVWIVHVPTGGTYHVKVEGDFIGFGVNPQLWLGHGPPLPGNYVPLVGAIIGVAWGIGWFFWSKRKSKTPVQS